MTQSAVATSVDDLPDACSEEEEEESFSFVSKLAQALNIESAFSFFLQAHTLREVFYRRLSCVSFSLLLITVPLCTLLCKPLRFCWFEMIWSVQSLRFVTDLIMS